MLQVGNKAPDFTAALDDGTTVKLSRLKGGIVVLYFYPKDDTSGCTAEAKDFTALSGEFAAAGATIIGISPDGVAQHVKFKAKHGLAVALAADEDKAIAEAYGVWVEKSMYGKKYMGVERTTVLVDGKGKIVRVWPKVKVPGHAAEVLAAVKQLASG